MAGEANVFAVEDRRRGRYGLIYLEDIDHDDFRALPSGAKLVYFALLPFAAAATGRAYPKAETLARITGLSVRTVRRATADLEGAGFIEVSKKHLSEWRRVNLYTLIGKV